MKRSALAALGILLGLAVSATAHAAGAPVLGYGSPWASLRSADGTYVYRLRAQHRHTLIEESTPQWTLSHAIPGTFVIPFVTIYGATGGLSAQRRVLVLVRPRTSFPQRSTELALVDADSLRLVRTVQLKGDFAYDAISPGGAWVYLIQYVANDPSHYRVRALDARSGRLLRHDIVDPHDRGEKMQGLPLARAVRSDGRWTYTLYGATGRPFIHALNTAGLTARCIDLHLPANHLTASPPTLRIAGDRLAVLEGQRTLTVLDTRTWRPVSSRTRPAVRTAASSSPIAALLGGVVALIALIGAVAMRRAHA